jgi:hypothetical protein
LSDFFGETGDADEFALPGDQATLEAIAAQQEPPVEGTGERARGEDGRFVKADTAEEAPAEAAEAEPETPAKPELILGKFKDADALAAAYQELESHTGGLRNEVGDLRKALDERFESLQTQVSQPVTPQTPITQDLIDQNPALATELAYTQGNQAALAVAFEEWEAQQPARAAAWIASKHMEARDAQWSERYSQLEQRIAPMQQQAQGQELRDGVSGLTQKYPEISEFVQTEDFAALAAQIPLAKKALTEGTPAEVVSAIETVYLIHRGRATDNLAETSREVTRAAAQEAEKVREEAFVASATATAGAAVPSRADQIAAGWDDTDDMFKSGWNV